MSSIPDAEPVVRLALEEEAVQIVALQKALFPGDVNHLVTDDVGSEPNRTCNPLIVLACHEVSIVGFTVLRNRGSRPWTGINFVGVSSQAAGRGIGGMLVNAAAHYSPRRMLRLFVRPSNTAARALYRHCGFRHVSTRKANYSHGEDALVLMQ